MSGWKDDDSVTITYRTLCQAQAEAAAAERERIINLLRDYAENRTQYCKPLDAEHCQDCFESVRLIALIKGDNK